MASAAFTNHAPSGSAEESPFPLVSSPEEHIALRNQIATHPRGGAVLFVHALVNYFDPATRELGEQLLVLCMAEDRKSCENYR